MRRSVPLALTALVLAVAGCGGANGDAGKATTATNAQERPLPTTARAPSEPQVPGSTAGEQEPGTGTAPVDVKPARKATPVAIQEGSTKGKRVALTFDADMTPDMLSRLQSGSVPEQYNREVIRQLRKFSVPATLFITGMWAQVYPGQVEQFARDPLFEIGNHTYDHRGFTGDCYGLPSTNGPDAQRAEVSKTQKILSKLTGQAPFWFRYPGLCHTDADNALVAGEGVQAVDGLGSGDAFQSDPQVIVSTVLGEVKPGSIIVMHMMGGPNAPASGEALKTLIPALRDQGYDLVSLDRLIPRR